MAERPIHGAGCLCGAVRITIAAEPMGARLCLCRLCQYLSAGSGTVNVVFPTEEVRTSGEVRWYESVADSGNHMRRGFCPECGTPLMSLAESRPHLTIIRAGALDDPNLIAPQATIWTKEAPVWAHIDPDLPRYDGQIPPAP
ncbi:GFA family protein [Sphingobium sp. H39-3-25]|uniref:GFA family protein n=1 Tax=Sphingobium arseniciresistens TaxID=3030834 RepID=UPI0023B919EE|nr:GFA family protein [Sphingobium arseniciresistens]